MVPQQDHDPADQEVRSSTRETAKWIVASAAAVGATLLTGLQFKDFGPAWNEGSWPERALGAGGAVLALGSVTLVLTAAARVLIVRSMSLTDLSRREADRFIKERSRWLGRLRRRDHLLDWIDRDRATLFPPGVTSAHDLKQRLAASRRELADPARGEPDAERLTAQIRQYERMAAELIERAQAFAVQRAYRRLIPVFIAGVAGVLAGLMIFVIFTAGAPDALVTRPTAVTIVFNPGVGRAELRKAGLNEACTEEPLQGVAVGGTFRRPRVATLAVFGPKGEVRCPAAGFRVTESLGTAIPRPVR